MTRFPVRILAIALLLGQLAQASGGAFCVRQVRDSAAQCDDGMSQPAGASVTAPMGGMAAGFCNLMGPCGTLVPALTTAPVANRSVPGDNQLAVALIPVPPESFPPVPVPPPPQA